MHKRWKPHSGLKIEGVCRVRLLCLSFACAVALAFDGRVGVPRGGLASFTPEPDRGHILTTVRFWSSVDP